VHPRTISIPESPPDKASTTPQTIQTYIDFKDSLSEDERENFFNFVREETKNLEKRINDLEAWLASKNQAQQNRWEVYYNNFLASLKSKGLDPQKPPIDNKCQQAVKRYEEELERRKKAAQSAWEKRQLEQQTNLNQLEVKVNKLLSIDSKSQTMEVKND